MGVFFFLGNYYRGCIMKAAKCKDVVAAAGCGDFMLMRYVRMVRMMLHDWRVFEVQEECLPMSLSIRAREYECGKHIGQFAPMERSWGDETMFCSDSNIQQGICCDCVVQNGFCS